MSTRSATFLLLVQLMATIESAIDGHDGLVAADESKCLPSGTLDGMSHHCNQQDYSDCCQAGQSYPQFECSPPIQLQTPAVLTLNCFQKGGCGGGPSECDNSFHSDNDPVVALSTGWYNDGKRCGNQISITARGTSVTAVVVDECDSINGCDAEHDFQPPCGNNIVDASPAVWEALGISPDDPDYGYMDITWSEA